MADNIKVSDGVKVTDGIINIKIHLKTFAEKILSDLQNSPDYQNAPEIKGKSIKDEGVMQYLISLYSGHESTADLLRLQNAFYNAEKFDIEITGFLRKQLDYQLEDGNNTQQLVGVKIHNKSRGNDIYLRLEQRYHSGDALSFGRPQETYGIAKVAASGHSTLSSIRCREPIHATTEGLEEYIRVYSRPSTPF